MKLQEEDYVYPAVLVSAVYSPLLILFGLNSTSVDPMLNPLTDAWQISRANSMPKNIVNSFIFHNN